MSYKDIIKPPRLTGDKFGLQNKRGLDIQELREGSAGGNAISEIRFNFWYDEYIGKMFSTAIEVGAYFNCKAPPRESMVYSEYPIPDFKYLGRALVIGMQPYSEEQTAEDLLRELVNASTEETLDIMNKIQDFVSRTKKNR